MDSDQQADRSHSRTSHVVGGFLIAFAYLGFPIALRLYDGAAPLDSAVPGFGTVAIVGAAVLLAYVVVVAPIALRRLAKELESGVGPLVRVERLLARAYVWVWAVGIVLSPFWVWRLAAGAIGSR